MQWKSKFLAPFTRFCRILWSFSLLSWGLWLLRQCGTNTVVQKFLSPLWLCVYVVWYFSLKSSIMLNLLNCPLKCFYLTAGWVLSFSCVQLRVQIALLLHCWCCQQKKKEISFTFLLSVMLGDDVVLGWSAEWKIVLCWVAMWKNLIKTL